ncbi:GL25613 [Drosophila persimilis]|uniref:GL25613 n=1 Tax=Drosophila persimilis TaxID=7234 RepID=B4GKX5_DROPE|nr:GL25613 [Drosophila persimilis]
MEFSTLDDLTVHLATGVLRVLQDCGPATKEDIVMKLGKEWNIRWRDFSELLFVVGGALESGIEAGLMIEDDKLYKVCEGYDYQHMKKLIAAPQLTPIQLNEIPKITASGSKDQMTINKAPQTAATKIRNFLDTFKKICRILFDELL